MELILSSCRMALLSSRHQTFFVLSPQLQGGDTRTARLLIWGCIVAMNEQKSISLSLSLSLSLSRSPSKKGARFTPRAQRKDGHQVHRGPVLAPDFCTCASAPYTGVPSNKIQNLFLDRNSVYSTRCRIDILSVGTPRGFLSENYTIWLGKPSQITT